MPQLEFTGMLPADAITLQNYTHNPVEYHLLDWGSAWGTLLRTALDNRGADVSEVGSTWVVSLAEMQALYSVSRTEINTLGGEATFLPAAFRSCQRINDPQVWAVPFTTETRLLYYRKDLFDKAGIDASQAFQSNQALFDALERLKSLPDVIPWTMTTTELSLLHNMATWVWGSGGDFRTPDGRHIRLHQPPAIQGVVDFYRLGRYLQPGVAGLSVDESDALFREGKAAVAFSGNWLLRQIKALGPSSSWTQNLGTAAPPGTPYLGGSNLVFWRHSHYTKAGLDLAGFLTSQPVQLAIFNHTGNLPAREDVLHLPAFINEPHLEVIAQCLIRGRSFNAGYRWAAIEARLVAFLIDLWKDVLTKGDFEVETEVPRRVQAFVEFLEKTILT